MLDRHYLSLSPEPSSESDKTGKEVSDQHRRKRETNHFSEAFTLFYPSCLIPHRLLCNRVQREGVKPSPDLASELFCYASLHKIWYGIILPMSYFPRISVLGLEAAMRLDRFPQPRRVPVDLIAGHPCRTRSRAHASGR